ncbi:MAG: hypothetical protein V4670_03060 [Bacteroidota bacterium]
MKNIIVFIISIFATSCTNDSESDLTDPVPIVVKYATDVRPIIQANCIECHTDPPENGAPMPLLTYENVRDAVIDRGLIDRISSTDPSFLMPYGRDRLPQSKIDIIIAWKNSNYPE